MWTKYQVRLDFLTKLVGSVPADKDLIGPWLKSRQPTNRPPDSKSIEEVATEVLETLPDKPVESALLVFQRHEGGLAVRLATVRAHLKDCAKILSRLYVGKVEKETSFAVKVTNSVYYDPSVYWLPIRSQLDGQVMREPSGRYQKAIHAMTPRGQISALKELEFCEGAYIEVPIWILTPKNGRPVIGDTDLATLFEYGGTHGYAGERSDGEGRYIATITLEK